MMLPSPISGESPGGTWACGSHCYGDGNRNQRTALNHRR